MFRDSSRPDNFLSRNRHKRTMFLAWMDANRIYSQVRNLTYVKFPSKFTYDAEDRS